MAPADWARFSGCAKRPAALGLSAILGIEARGQALRQGVDGGDPGIALPALKLGPGGVMGNDHAPPCGVLSLLEGFPVRRGGGVGAALRLGAFTQLPVLAATARRHRARMYSSAVPWGVCNPYHARSWMSVSDGVSPKARR